MVSFYIWLGIQFYEFHWFFKVSKYDIVTYKNFDYKKQSNKNMR